MKKQALHQKLVYNLADRLRKKKYYQTVMTNYEYYRYDMIGEMDVVAITKKGTWHYYEIKCNHTNASEIKARYQAWKAYHAYYDRKLRFVMVTQQDVMRIRPKYDENQRGTIE